MLALVKIIGNEAIKTNDNKEQVTIDEIHHKVHQGSFYNLSYRATGILNNGTVVLHLKTGDKDFHIWNAVKEMIGTFSATWRINGTYTNNGTALTVYNNNTNYLTETPLLNAYHTPTISAPGTQCFSTINAEGVSTNQIKTISSHEMLTERILKKNSDFSLTVINLSGGTQNISIFISGYLE